MNTVLFLRKRVFKVSQLEFARIAGTGQAAVSRWENGMHSPSLDQIKRIRDEAHRRALPWDHNWLFTPVPDETSAPTVSA